MRRDLRNRLEMVLPTPTAPFFEDLVHDRLKEAAAGLRGVRVREDEHGNIELVYGPGRPKLLYAAHTDHPAMIYDGDGAASASGGIRVKELVGHGLKTFDGATRVEVTGVKREKHPGTVRLKGARGLKQGTPLILDVPDLRITRNHVRARVIDDLCSVAVCLTVLDRLSKSGWKGTLGCVFTRAEEVGFVGALGWIRSTSYPKSTTIVNLETSRALPTTPLGSGPVIRVGDRTSTFHPDVTLELAEAAKPLPHQRALMDGGGCEATVFLQGGFRAGALCLPTKNIHNHKPRGGMGLEFVHSDDVEHLVQLLVRFAKLHGSGKLNARAKLGKRLDRYWKKHRKSL